MVSSRDPLPWVGHIPVFAETTLDMTTPKPREIDVDELVAGVDRTLPTRSQSSPRSLFGLRARSRTGGAQATDLFIRLQTEGAEASLERRQGADYVVQVSSDKVREFAAKQRR